MQFVPAPKPRSAWRVLILFVATLLTLGVLAPATASTKSRTPQLRVHDKVVFLHTYDGYRHHDGNLPGQVDLTRDRDGDRDGYRGHHGYWGHHKYVKAYVKITLNKAAKKRVSVGWYTKSGTAKAWRDFKPAGGRAYIAKGKKVTYVKVLVKKRTWFPRFDRDRCELPNAQQPENSTGSVPSRDWDRDRYGDHHDKWRHHHPKFFMIKLVKPRGARIADGLAFVKIIKIKKDFGHRDGRFDGRDGRPDVQRPECPAPGPVVTTPEAPAAPAPAA
jgi:hypothetical protein